jgi:uncharacterized protein
MLIEIDKLPNEGAAFTRDFAPDEFAFEDEEWRLIEPLRAEFFVTRKRDEVEVGGKLRGAAEAACDRCLKAMRLPVNADFMVTYSPVEAARACDLHELHAADMERATYEHDQIDLRELAREQLLLEISVRVLCREDCKGLCPNCRANLNEQACACETKEIDPRWSALAEARRNDER